jgi:hypothetical protein
MKMRIPMLSMICGLALSVILPGCESSPADDETNGTGGNGTDSAGGSTGGTDGNPNETCAGLDEAECVASEDCSPLFGRGWVSGDSHDGNASFQGCAYGLCGTESVCGYDPEAEGKCWWFPENCLPRGWTKLDCLDDVCPFGGASGSEQ